MILQFLRAFPLFRALESDRDATVLQLREDLQEENTQRLILQDRLDAAQETVSKLWAMVESSQQRSYRAMEMQVNFATQQRFGVVPYPEGQQLPESLHPDLTSSPVIARNRMPSEAVAAGMQKFERDLMAHLAGSRKS